MQGMTLQDEIECLIERCVYQIRREELKYEQN